MLVFQGQAAIGGVLLVVARMGEGVIALHLPRSTHLFGVAEAMQGRFCRIAAAHGLVKHRAVFVGADGAKAADAIGEDQGVAIGAVFEGVKQAFFSSETGNKVEIGFTRLHAVFAGLVIETDLFFEVGDALALEHQSDDLGHGFVLKHPPVGAQARAGQGRFDHRVVAGTAKTGVALTEQTDQTMDIAHRRFAAPHREQRAQIEDTIKVHRRVVADQVQG